MHCQGDIMEHILKSEKAVLGLPLRLQAAPSEGERKIAGPCQHLQG